MNYSTEIEAYSEGQMSAVERMAFEHELEDNTALQAEWESHQLVQDLLAEVTSQLTVEDILTTESTAAITTQPKAFAESRASVKSTYRPLALIALLCCTCFYYILEYGDFQQQPTIEDSSKSIAVPEGIPVAAQLMEKDPKKEEQKVFQEYKEEPTPIIKESVAAPLDKKKEKIRPIALNEKHFIHRGAVAKNTQLVTYENQNSTTTFSKTATSRASDVESSEQLKSGEAVKMIASNSITLKPGFHAKAGTSFTAEIGDK